MLKKMLGVMLSVMVIGGVINYNNIGVNMEKKQCIQVAELGSADAEPM